MSAPKKKYPSVHKGLTLTALYLCGDDYYKGYEFLMTEEVIKPDLEGDREVGAGKHYYLTHKAAGKKRRLGYGKNGRKANFPSLKTMFEEDYSSAVLMKSKDKEEALRLLARALHMAQDSLCPPHRAGWTYFSPYKTKHQKYEMDAAAVFWGEDPNADIEKVCREKAEKILKDYPKADNYGDIIAQPISFLTDKSSVESQMDTAIKVSVSVLKKFLTE